MNPMTFPPAVLARISPELSLQRHLSIGIRPNLRTFEEFRQVHVTNGGLSRYSNDGIKDTSVLGCSVLRCGKTSVITTISGGIVEEDLPTELINEDAAAVNAVFAKGQVRDGDEDDKLQDYAGVYPIVEVERGRVGAPTDEEMILSQRVYDTLLHSRILSKKALKVNVGLRSVDKDGNVDVYYRDDDEDDDDFNFGPKRSWRFVLYAKIKVFSRSGPLFDMVWCGLIKALQNTFLPMAFIDEDAADVKVPVKMHGQFGTIREEYQITCDAVKKQPLALNSKEIGMSCNFGIVDIDQESFDTVDDDNDGMEIDGKSVVLTDVEGEEEEVSCRSTISMVNNGDEFKSLMIIGRVARDELKKCIELGKLRYKI